MRFSQSRFAVATRGLSSARGNGPYMEGQDPGELFDVLMPLKDFGFLEPELVQLSGLQKQRFEVHRDGDWHRSVHLWLLLPPGAGQGPQLVLQQRADTKDTHPGLWDVSVAGHFEAGGESIETVVREAEEEVGVVLKAQDLERIFTIAVESRGNTARHGPFVCREVQDVYLHELPATSGESELQNFRLATGEVLALRREPVEAVLAALRAGSPTHVPRGKRYVDALASAITRRCPGAAAFI